MYFTAFHVKDWPFIVSSFQFSLKSMTQSSKPLNLQTMSLNPHNENNGFCVRKKSNHTHLVVMLGINVTKVLFQWTEQRVNKLWSVWVQIHLELNTISHDCIFIDKVSFNLAKQAYGEGTSSAIMSLWTHVVSIGNYCSVINQDALSLCHLWTHKAPQISSQSRTQHNILIPVEYRNGPRQCN